MICPSCLAGPGQGHDPDCNADRRPRERGVHCDEPLMETPEEFMAGIQDDWDSSEERMVPLYAERVRARDNAVRLALLDELEARAAGMIPYPLREQVAKLRLKYTPPRGKP